MTGRSSAVDALTVTAGAIAAPGMALTLIPGFVGKALAVLAVAAEAALGAAWFGAGRS